MSTVVQSIVAFQLTGRNGAVGVVLLGQGLAMALLGPLGGAVADRVPKKLVSVVTQLVIACVFLAIGMLVAAGAVTIAFLALGSFVVGTMFAFMGPARQAWVVELVGPELRANAVALTQVMLNASRVIAPAFAGLLVAIAVVGAAGAYFVMASFYVVVVLSFLLLPRSRRPEASGRSVMGDLVAGFRYVGGEPRLRAMMLLFFLMIMLGLSAYAAVLPGLVENQLGRSVEAYGTLQAVNAAGGLVASLFVAPLAGTRRAFPAYALMAAITGISIVLTGLAPTYLIAFVPILMNGVAFGAFQTLNSAVIVLESDPAYYGRVTSLTSLAFAGFMLAGFPVGLLADALGERVALVILGLLTTAAVIVMTPIIARASRAARHAEPACGRGAARERVTPSR